MEAKNLQQSARRAADKVREAGKAVKRHPAVALGTAVAAGFIAGLILRLFERPARDEN